MYIERKISLLKNLIKYKIKLGMYKEINKGI